MQSWANQNQGALGAQNDMDAWWSQNQGGFAQPTAMLKVNVLTTIAGRQRPRLRPSART